MKLCGVSDTAGNSSAPSLSLGESGKTSFVAVSCPPYFMRKARFADEQMVAIIREADREPVPAVAKQLGISEHYAWRRVLRLSGG